MTLVSTALLYVGPKSVGPWGDNAWRISGTAQLVEGSSPYWIVTSTQPVQHRVTPDEIEVAAPQDACVVESILFLLASHFGGDVVEKYLVETHNISVGQDGTRELARFYEVVDDAKDFLARHLCEVIRLGITRLDETSLVNDAVIGAMRDLGFDLAIFTEDVSAQI